MTSNVRVLFQINDTGSWKTVASLPSYQDQKVTSTIDSLKRQYPNKLIRAVQNGMLVQQA